MSIMDEDGVKRILTRNGPDDFWKFVLQNYVEPGGPRKKHVAMLALRECADWPVRHIAEVFGHRTHHVKKCLASIRRRIRDDVAFGPGTSDGESERQRDTGTE